MVFDARAVVGLVLLLFLQDVVDTSVRVIQLSGVYHRRVVVFGLSQRSVDATIVKLAQQDVSMVHHGYLVRDFVLAGDHRQFCVELEHVEYLVEGMAVEGV